jgi:hypothetical protein
VGHHTEAFVGIDTSKSRNAIAIADGGRGGEVRYLGESPSTEAAIQKLVAKLAAKTPSARRNLLRRRLASDRTDAEIFGRNTYSHESRWHRRSRSRVD